MDIEKQRSEAARAYDAGETGRAIELQQALLDQQDPKDPESMTDLLLLARYLSAVGGYEPILRLLEQRRDIGVKRFDYCMNMGVCYQKLGRLEDALKMLLSARKLEPESADVHVRLSNVLRVLEREQEALRCGELALLLKSKEVTGDQAWPLPETRPVFRRDQPGRNIIAFSIPRPDTDCLQGALNNALAAALIYPGWSCRFYIANDLPREFLRQLVSCGVSLAQVSGQGRFRDPAMWPLHVCSDPDVDFFLIRDVRALLNVRERVAVDEWLAGKGFFHVMRDHWSQTELLPQGMWGGTGGILPKATRLLKGYQPPSLRDGWVSDLYAHRVWPTVRQSCLVHDSCYQAFAARPFPAGGALPPGQYLGQDQRGWRQAAPLAAWQADMRMLAAEAGRKPWSDVLQDSGDAEQAARASADSPVLFGQDEIPI